MEDLNVQVPEAAAAQPPEVPPEVPQDQGPAPAVFALTPGQANQGIYDFTLAENVKLYNRATKPLDPDNLFDCTPDTLNQFLSDLTLRCSEYGWDDETVGILQIPDTLDPATQNFASLLTSYGTIVIGTILAHEQTYIHLPNRAAQDNHMLYHMLMASLSRVGKSKISVWHKQYTIKRDGTTYYSGPLLLKVIIRESHLDSKATITSIRTQLSSLDTAMQACGSDIGKFNNRVMGLRENLGCRGETTEDLLVNLFKGYAAASDRTFVEYMARQQEYYDDGKSMTANELMVLAENKYKNLKIMGKWNAPTAEQEELIALKAEISKLRKAAKSSNKNPGKRAGGKKEGGNKKKPKKPEWLLNHTKPADDKIHKVREWGGLDWHWCHPLTGGCCEGKWRRHMPSECKPNFYEKKDGKQEETTDTTIETSGDKRFRKQQNKMKIAKAMAAVAAKNNTDEDSE